MFRVSITLNEPELKALLAMAQADCRHPRDELRYIFMQAARERGLLAADEAGTEPEPNPQTESKSQATGSDRDAAAE